MRLYQQVNTILYHTVFQEQEKWFIYEWNCKKLISSEAGVHHTSN